MRIRKGFLGDSDLDASLIDLAGSRIDLNRTETVAGSGFKF